MLVSCDLFTRTDLVIIKNTQITLSGEPHFINLEKSAKVVGKTSNFCAVLDNDIEAKEISKTETTVNSYTNGNILLVTATSTEGDIYNFSGSSNTWKKIGIVTESNELAICARNRDRKLDIGTEFNIVAISSSGNFVVKGIYWESTRAYDNLN